MTRKLAFATACLAILFAVVVKPTSAIENNLSGELTAQSFNNKPFTEETSQKPDSSRKDESWLMPVLWGLGGYLIGSMIGTQKTYTKMNKGERKIPPFS
ncbi:MAG: hypothetical protein HC836_00720 [Richelia sp. RM2_1_2]|nr:hypothetical protein [Richelia sp. SL_2_1]NJO56948.1 hypothetical protein [Richelia sp. RM2_1_2]